MSTSDVGLFAEQRRGRSLRRRLPLKAVNNTVLLVDFLVIVLSSLITGVAYHFFFQKSPGSLADFFASGTLIAAMFVPILKSAGAYHPVALLQDAKRIKTVVLAWAATLGLFLGAVFALKAGDTLSRGAVLSFAIVTPFALLLHRIWWSEYLTRAVDERTYAGWNAIVLYDQNSATTSNVRQQLDQNGFGHARQITLPTCDETELKSRLDEIIQTIRGTYVDEVLLATDCSDSKRLKALLAQLKRLPLPVSLIPDPSTANLLVRPRTDLGGTILVEVQRAPLSLPDRALKRALDIACAALGLLVFMPLLVIAAIAVKAESSGPVFFRQLRLGFNGRPFRILKFRTMDVLEDGPEVKQASRNDPRITAVGSWLRRTSIDELPQLVNVLIGEMSIVGPRPHALAHDRFYADAISAYEFRQHVKPGITGWAQISGLRGETPTVAAMEKRIDADLWYARNWSLWLDVKIMLKTLLCVVRHRSF